MNVSCVPSSLTWSISFRLEPHAYSVASLEPVICRQEGGRHRWPDLGTGAEIEVHTPGHAIREGTSGSATRNQLPSVMIIHGDVYEGHRPE